MMPLNLMEANESLQDAKGNGSMVLEDANDDEDNFGNQQAYDEQNDESAVQDPDE